MTEPDDNPTAGFDVAEPMTSAASTGFGYVWLATHEPHTLLVAPELAITPAGTKVPADQADDYISTGRANGVHVFKKEAK